MTGIESGLIMGELRHLRGLIERIDGSLTGCQAVCALERSQRRSWIRWVGGLLLALLPGALMFYVQKGR